MRPFVLAGILAALAGCSLPYEGTSFKALPKPEHMAEGEHRETNDHEGEAHEGAGHEAAPSEEGGHPTSQPEPEAEAPPVEKDPMDRTGVAFPPTAQPGE